jgi:F420H(2)-dependent quinone reductase
MIDEPIPEDQRNQPYDEPPREQIPAISRAHVAAMEATEADVVWVAAGMHHLVLRTIGRRSGKEHKVALPFWRDPSGVHVVVASFAGSPSHPAWYRNVADRAVNPLVHVRLQHGAFWAEPEILDGSDYERTWALLVSDRPFYDGYRSRTRRRLPLVRLVERPAPAAAPPAGQVAAPA